MPGFEFSDDEIDAMLFLRAKAAQIRERAEFHLERGNKDVHDALMTAYMDTPNGIGLVISTAIIRWLQEPPALDQTPSELYDDCETLSEAIARFCVDWGFSKSKLETFEEIYDLEEEFNICYGEETI